MTNPFREAAKKSVWYPDEQPELEILTLKSEDLVSAEDVPHEEARFGDYVQCEDSGIGTVWLACPKDFQRALGDEEATPGHTFRVRNTIEGDGEHEPWQYELDHDV